MSPALATLAPFRFAQRVSRIGKGKNWEPVCPKKTLERLVDEGYPLASWTFDPVDLLPHEQARLSCYLARGTYDLDAKEQADRYALLDRCRKVGGWFGAVDLDAREGAENHLPVALDHARKLDASLAKQGLRCAWYQTNARGGLHADLLLPPGTGHVHLPRGFLRLLRRAAAEHGIPLLEDHLPKEGRPPVVLDAERLDRGGATTLFRLPGAAKTEGGFRKTPLDLARGVLLESHAVLPFSDPTVLLAACEEVAEEFRARLARGLAPRGLRTIDVQVTPDAAATKEDLAWLEATDPSLFRSYLTPHEEAGNRHRREYGMVCRLMRLGADDERVARLMRSKSGGVLIADGERKFTRTLGHARAHHLDAREEVRGGAPEDAAAPPIPVPELTAAERRLLAWAALKEGDDDHPLIASHRLRLLTKRIAECCESLMKFLCRDGHIDRVAPNACGSPLCPACHFRRAAPQLAYLAARLGARRLDVLTWRNPSPTPGDPRAERAALRAAEADLRRRGVHRKGILRTYLKVAGLRAIVILVPGEGYSARELAKHPDLVAAGWTCRDDVPAADVRAAVAEVYAEPYAELQRLLAARDDAGVRAFLEGRRAHVVRVSMSRPGKVGEIPWLAETRRRAEGKAAAEARRQALGEGPWDPTVCHHRVVGPDGKGCACGKPLTPTAVDRRGEVLARGIPGGKAWPVAARAFAVLAARRAAVEALTP